MAAFEIEGLKEVQRALNQLESKLQKKAARSAMRAGTKIMAEQVKQNATVLTGATKRAVKVRAFKGLKRGEIGYQVQIGEGDFKGNTFYASFVNYGTSKIKPTYFMNNAIEQKGDQASTTAQNILLNEIMKFK